jgi:hypothetical protein
MTTNDLIFLSFLLGMCSVILVMFWILAGYAARYDIRDHARQFTDELEEQQRRMQALRAELKEQAQTAHERAEQAIQKARAKREANILLRPAVWEETGQTLLRPAQGGIETHPEQLLKPVSDEPKGE